MTARKTSIHYLQFRSNKYQVIELVGTGHGKVVISKFGSKPHTIP